MSQKQLFATAEYVLGLYQGGCTRVGIRVGIPGCTTQPPARGGPRYSEAGPGSPESGLEWVVSGAGRTGLWDGGGDGPGYHPCGARSVLPRQPLPVPRTLQIAALQPIRARIEVISSKVSQNGQVSPEYDEKASHSPCLQNGLGKSPLEIPRFPFWPAFSHKELMTVF